MNKILYYHELKTYINNPNILRNHINLDWGDITANYELSEEFIITFIDDFDISHWANISLNQKLSEEFIRLYSNKVNWLWISTKQKLSEEFILEFRNKVNWSQIAKNQILSIGFIVNNKKYFRNCYGFIFEYQKGAFPYFIENNIFKTISPYLNDDDWSKISEHLILNNEFILKYKKKLKYKKILEYQKLNIDLIFELFELNNKKNLNELLKNQKINIYFIDYYLREINLKNLWPIIYEYQKFNEKEIKKLLNYKNNSEIWYFISSYQILSEKFIEEYMNNVNLEKITLKQNLSLNFLRKNIDKFNGQCWDNISWYQKLNEDFLREFEDYVDYEGISERQEITENYIRDYCEFLYIDKITSRHIPLHSDFDMSLIPKQPKLSENFIRGSENYVCWSGISLFQNLSEKFIEEFKHKINWQDIFKNNTIIFSKKFLIKYLSRSLLQYKIRNLNKYYIYKLGDMGTIINSFLN
jgi:hypothetical protein